jgi:hypothetical protein
VANCSLTRLTRDYMRLWLSYRFEVYPSGKQALVIEHDIRARKSSTVRPYLNPLYLPELALEGEGANDR